MATDTFSGLKSEIAAWVARDDLTARIPVFIEMTEADLNKRLRLRYQEGRATSDTVTGADTVSLPADYASARNLTITSTAPISELDFYSPQGLEEAFPGTTTAKPRGWAILGEDIYLRPVPDTTYTLTLNYFKKITALSDAAPSNWILLNAPDVYLFGALAQYGIYSRQPDVLQMWQPKYEAEIAKLVMSDRLGGYPRGKFHMRAPSRMVV